MKCSLESLLKYEQPTKYIVASEEYSDEYPIPVLTAGKSFILGYTNEETGILKASIDPVIIYDDFTTDSKYVDFDFKVKSSAMKILHKINEEDNLRYLFYVVSYLKYTPFSHKRTWISDFSKFRIEYSSPKEQNSIVSELDKIQAALDNKKEQLKKLDELIQSKFYEMFGDPVANDKGWEVQKLGMQAKVKGGYAFKSSLFETSGIPVLRIGNINSGKLRLEPIVFYAEDEKLSKYLIYPNELVISLTGTAGKDDYANVCKIDDSFNKYYLNQRNAKIELSKNIVVEYMQYLLKDRDIKLKLTGINRGVRQGNISNKDIENLIIPLPPLPLQQAFAAYVEKVEQAKAIVNQEIAHLQELLNSRMDFYFRK